MTGIDGAAAARTLLSYRLAQRGMCLYYVWQAYDAHGADTTRQAGTAMGAWELAEGRHPGDRNPPPGVPVYWGRRRSDGNRDGDITISLGDGRVAATDYPTWLDVGTPTIDQREAQIGRDYLGWSEAIFDAPIAGTALARQLEDDMTPDELLGTRITVRGGNATVTVQEALSAAFDGYEAIKDPHVTLTDAQLATLAEAVTPGATIGEIREALDGLAFAVVPSKSDD